MEKNYTEEYIEIGGISHYFLTYEGKQEQPLVLFLHGGPGQTECSFAYHIEDYAERTYTAVYYDQRGTGKTYKKNKKIFPSPLNRFPTTCLKS